MWGHDKTLESVLYTLLIMNISGNQNLNVTC